MIFEEPLLSTKSESSLIDFSCTREKSSLRGLALICLATFIFSGINIFVKELEQDDIPFLQVSLVRYIVVIFLAGPIIVHKKCNGSNMSFFGPKKDRSALIARAIVYYGATNLYYWALMYISLGLCTIISFTFPLLTATISHFGCCSEPEKLSKFGWMCTLIGFLGIFLVVSSEMADSVIYGILLTFASACCWAVQLVLIRRTRAEAHWLQIEFLTACIHSLVLTPSVMFVQYLVDSYMKYNSSKIINVYIKPLQWGDCLLIGAIAFIGLGFFTRGFQLEEAPRGAIIMYLEIPFIYFAQWIMFGRGVSLAELSGICLVLSGNVGAATEKILIDRGRNLKIHIAKIGKKPQDCP